MNKALQYIILMVMAGIIVSAQSGWNGWSNTWDAASTLPLGAILEADMQTMVDSQHVTNLLYTGTRTGSNLLLRTDNMNVSPWGNFNLSGPGAVAMVDELTPSGGKTGVYKAQAIGANAFLSQVYTATIPIGASYTFGAWVKNNGGGTSQKMFAKRNTTGTTLESQTCNITLTNAWQRFSCTITFAAAHIDLVAQPILDAGSGNLNALVYGPTLNLGTVDLGFEANPLPDLILGATAGSAGDDPAMYPSYGLRFLAGQQVSNLPTKPTTWTIINCKASRCEGIDSASGSYINGVALAGATEHNIGTASGYTGPETYRVQWQRVLTAAEEAQAFRYLRAKLRNRWDLRLAQKTHGVVTFEFDDADETDYTIAYPVFLSRGVSGVSNIITNDVGTAAKLSVPEMTTMAATGWEIGSHTVDHAAPSGDLTTMSQADITAELQNSLTALRGWGFDVVDICYPGGSYNDTVIAVARGIYPGGSRSTGVGQNIEPMMTYSLNTYDAGDSSLLTTYEGYVDAAYSANAWLVFMLHATDSGHATMLASLLDYIAAKPMPILSHRAAAAYLANPMLFQ